MSSEGSPPGTANATLDGLAVLGGADCLTTSHRRALASVAVGGDLATGDRLYTAGDSSRDLFVILSGELFASRATPLGPVRLATLQNGSLAGEPSFLDGGPREATLLATEPTSVLRLPLATTVALMDADEGLALALQRLLWLSLACRLRQANREMLRIMGSVAPTAPTLNSHDTCRTNATPTEKLDVLLASGLTAQGLELLAATMRSERFADGDLIVAEGSSSDILYVVAEGQARVSRRVTTMGEEALQFLGRGGVFGEVGFVDGSSRSADVRAHQGDCVVLSVNRTRLDGFLTEHPAAAGQLLDLVCQTLCQRLRAMGNQLVAWRIMAGFGVTSTEPA